MNIAIIGASGYIAQFLLDKFERENYVRKIIKVGRHDSADVHFDLINPDMFDYQILNDIDYVIFAAAISEPDKCASDYDRSWGINVIGTKYFIKESLKRKCKVIFLSSDAVFGDIPGEIYTEKSETKPETPYGKMKKAVEDEFIGDFRFKSIRLSYVLSTKDRFLSYCFSCIKKGEVANIFHPLYRNVISVSDVVNVVDWMIKHWCEYHPCVLNVAGQELVSRVRIADELNRYLDNRLKYIISTPQSDFYKNRPKITQMQSLYLQEYGILENITFTEKIRNELVRSNIV